jgi:hypothetical protein
MSAMDAFELQHRLRESGVRVLTVTQNAQAGRDLTVYLRSNDGRLNQEEAIRCMEAMREIARVEVSPRTWSIIAVYLASPDADEADAAGDQAPRS